MTRHAVVFAEWEHAAPVIAGVSVLERLLRTLARCGIAEVTVLGHDSDRLRLALAPTDRARPHLVLTIRERAAGPPRIAELREAWPEAASHALVFLTPVMLDLRPVKALLRSQAPQALVDSTPPPDHAGGQPPEAPGPLLVDRAFVERCQGDLADAARAAIVSGAFGTCDIAGLPTYLPSMRRELRPWWLRAPLDEAQRRRAEDLVIGAAQKKALDFPAYFHAPIEDALVRALSTTRLTPNQASLAGNVVAWAATALFVSGRLGWGIVLALIVGVLDGVDGKLARVKVETSEAGKLEHWFDSLFEVSWAVALAFWFEISGTLPNAWWLLGLLLSAEAVDGLAKGAVIVARGRQIDDVAPFDRLVRLFGGRRNVYVWILAAGIAHGRPGPAFGLVAWWEAATAAVHVARAAWLLLERRVRVS